MSRNRAAPRDAILTIFFDFGWYYGISKVSCGIRFEDLSTVVLRFRRNPRYKKKLRSCNFGLKVPGSLGSSSLKWPWPSSRGCRIQLYLETAAEHQGKVLEGESRPTWRSGLITHT